jgi:hypothetical protein
MSKEYPKPLPPASTRQDMIIEAMLTVGEIRKPGYAQKVLEQLGAQAEHGVMELRPAAAAEDVAREREAAINWLRSAVIRARARASSWGRRKR